VIARLQGWTIGAGLEIAAACDLRIAADGALFAMPEVRMGLPGAIEAALLPLLIGWGRTRRLLLTGEPIDAATACAWGLVEEVVAPAELDRAVRRLVGDILAGGPRAVRGQKALIRAWEDLSPADAIARGIDAFAAAWDSDEPRTAWRRSWPRGRRGAADGCETMPANRLYRQERSIRSVGVLSQRRSVHNRRAADARNFPETTPRQLPGASVPFRGHHTTVGTVRRGSLGIAVSSRKRCQSGFWNRGSMGQDERPVAVLLAGGLARRMGGGDKPLRALAGRPLLDHVLDRIRPQVRAVALNANGDPARFAAWDLPVIADTLPDNPGPLAGVLAECAGGSAGAAEMVSVPTDTPFLPHDLVTRLAAARRTAGVPIACAASGGRTHPVAALWPVALADALEAALAGGMRRIDRWTATHGVAVAAFDDPAGDPFFNVNSADELAEAERLLGRPGASAPGPRKGPGGP